MLRLGLAGARVGAIETASPSTSPDAANRIRSFTIEPDHRRPLKAGALAPPLRGFQALTGRRRPGGDLFVAAGSVVRSY
jgi:hypothetical protein